MRVHVWKRTHSHTRQTLTFNTLPHTHTHTPIPTPAYLERCSPAPTSPGTNSAGTTSYIGINNTTAEHHHPSIKITTIRASSTTTTYYYHHPHPQATTHPQLCIHTHTHLFGQWIHRFRLLQCFLIIFSSKQVRLWLPPVASCERFFCVPHVCDRVVVVVAVARLRKHRLFVIASHVESCTSVSFPIDCCNCVLPRWNRRLCFVFGVVV